MAQIICEVGPGLRDTERTVAVRDVYNRKHFLRVELGFLSREGDRWYLPIGVVGIDESKGLALIELPHESDSGSNRLWTWMSEHFHEDDSHLPVAPVCTP
jgi:hypothetical protein